MDAGARRGGGGGQIQPGPTRPVRPGRRSGAQERARSRERSPRDVAAHEVRVPRLQIGRAHRDRGPDPVPEAGCVPLHLRLDQRTDVAGVAVGHMGVGPDDRVPPGGPGGPCGVRRLLLTEHDEGPRRHPAGRDVVLGPPDLGGGPAQVHRPRAREPGVAPRDRPVEQEVDLGHGRPGAPPAQGRGVARRQARAGDAQHLARGQVQHDGVRGGQRAQVRDLVAQVQPPAVRPQHRHERVDDRPRPAARHRPARAHPERAEERTERRRQGPARGQDRVGGRAREQGAGGLRAEHRPAQQIGRPRGAQAEAGHRHRMGRGSQHRAERARQDLVDVVDQGPVHGPPGPRVDAETRGGGLEVPVQEGGRPVRQRMSHRHGRVQPGEPVVRQPQLPEHGAGDAERMARRPEVHHGPLPQHRRGRARAAGHRGPLEHVHLPALAGQQGGGGQAVGSGAHDDGAARLDAPGQGESGAGGGFGHGLLL